MTACRNIGIHRSPALHTRSPGARVRLACSALALGSLAGCGSASEDGPVRAAHVYEPVGRTLDWNASAAVRFGFEHAAPSAAPSANGAASAAASSGDKSGGVSWMLPAGWSELEPTALRLVNLRVAGDEHAECYLTTLHGAGGGLSANVNRWRSQMGQPALGEAELAALPRQEWLGRQAVRIAIDGTFGGMSGENAAENWRLEGLLLVDASKSWFLKFTGPRERVLAEHERFLQLAASMQPGAEGAGAPNASAGAPNASAAPPKAPEPPARPANEPAAPSDYRWTVPAGWRVGPAKAMREVTLLAGASGEVECYVSSLAGEGGGLKSNLDRWRAQLGQPPLTEGELAALPRVAMLGAQALTIEIERAAGTSEGPEKLLGAVCILPRQSVFVKLGGPRAAVDAQRAAFLEFCRSLEAAK